MWGALSSYPPGYSPERTSYWHPVPETAVALQCGSFIITPEQNSVQIDNVVDKVLAWYGNPQQQDRSVFNGRDLIYYYEDGSPGHGETVLGIYLSPPPFADSLALKYGEVAAAVQGVDYIRRHWRMLDMCCSIMVQLLPGQLVDHGLITLHTEHE